jgi:hypothetical protein
MVLDMDTTIHITGIITTTITITTIIITTEIQVIQITLEELVAAITNQQAQQELPNHKIHQPLEITIAAVEIPGIMVETQIEADLVEAVDQEVLQVVDQAAEDQQEETVTGDLLEVLEAQEGDKIDFKYVEIKY